MIIGIVSDSHGNSRRLKAALAEMIRRQVKTIVHCGDIGSIDNIKMLGSVPAAIYLVAGNTDRQIDHLESTARRYNIHFAWEVVAVAMDEDRYLVATHGDDEQVLGSLVLGQQFPYICHGHTHHLRDERIGCARVINPGALHRCSRPTIVVLDTERDHIDVVDVSIVEGYSAAGKPPSIVAE